MSSNVGILGIGVHLPPVRRNDWWPETVVARWRERQNHFASPAGLFAEGSEEPLTDGARRVLEAIVAEGNSPFQGVNERRIAPDDAVPSDLEVLAARDALSKAGLDVGDIDFLLVSSTVPDYLVAPNACIVHHKLGLRDQCFSLDIQGACNSFMLQLTVAEQLIASGKFRRGLLVQSSLISRVLQFEMPSSAVLGDAATAVVVGPVEPGYGVLGHGHGTDGTNFHALVVGVPGKRWYEEGRNVLFAQDKSVARRLILAIGDRSQQSIAAALQMAGERAEGVEFYASHQGNGWLRRVTQEFGQLSHARSVDTFPWAASVTCANIPLVLATGAHEGVLRPGNLVVAFSGGLGETWSAIALRWGAR